MYQRVAMDCDYCKYRYVHLLCDDNVLRILWRNSLGAWPLFYSGNCKCIKCDSSVQMEQNRLLHDDSFLYHCYCSKHLCLEYGASCNDRFSICHSYLVGYTSNKEKWHFCMESTPIGMGWKTLPPSLSTLRCNRHYFICLDNGCFWKL